MAFLLHFQFPIPFIDVVHMINSSKDDESLRKWKQQLLGSVDLSAIAVGGKYA